MQKTLLFTIIVSAVMVCCTDKKSPSSSATDSLQIESLKQTPSKSNFTYQEGVMSGKFYLDSAATEVSSLLHDSTLHDLARTYAFGGTFRIDDFFPKSIHDTLQGVVMWFCYNPFDSNIKHKIFTSIEPRDTRTQSNRPLSPRLNIPDNTFPFRGSKTDIPSIKKFLIDHQIRPATNQTSPIDSSRVQTFMRYFNQYRLANPNPHGHPYVKYLGALFQNNKEKRTDTEGLLTRFVNQPGAEYVRYYLGYNENQGQNNNKIRIILVAVDGAGRNITRVEVPHATAFQEALLLQKSVPPGP